MNDAQAWNAHESEHHLGKCDVCGCDGFNDLKLMRTHHSVAHRGYQVWSLKKNRVICLLSVDGPLAYFEGKIGRSNFRAITAQLTVLEIFLSAVLEEFLSTQKVRLRCNENGLIKTILTTPLQPVWVEPS